MTKRFVSYLRVSTREQGASGLGIEAQRAAVARYVAAHGDLAREYTEIESGSDNGRAQLLAALAWCKLSGATLIVAKWDRLSRDAITLMELRRNGLPLVALDMPDMSNTLVASVMAGKAQHERELISERTKAALAAAKARGVQLGGRRANGADMRLYQAQGAAAAAAVLSEARAERMPVLSALRAQGLTHAAIAARLNADHITTVRGKAWSALSVGRALA
jgi:DNA invertase Pin-like site-specific DNA recombinase